MKLKIIIFIFFFTFVSVKSDECASITEDCNDKTEYNAYLDCLKEQKRVKRQTGCPFNEPNCEFVDCNDCDGCVNDGCTSSCRSCCTESCNDQLCCLKTCNNQCKTNYCR